MKLTAHQSRYEYGQATIGALSTGTSCARCKSRIGNLGQEMGALPESFRARLRATFEDWQHRLADCLVAAQQTGELADSADPAELAAFFWTGWEGAVLRAKLERSDAPLALFARFFFDGLPRR